MPRTAPPPTTTPFRLQVPLAEAVEHRAWRQAHLAVLDAIERGEPVAVLGPPGSGKTLLLRSVARALEALGWRVAQPGPDGLAAVPEEAQVLLLDEAGHLPPADLAVLLQQERPFVLAAPPAFATRLAALPRAVAWVTLGPMAPDEVARFVSARLAAAGRPPDLFTPEALQALARHSGGMVRLVLVLAGAALFAAESEGAAHVTQADVDEAAAMRTGGAEAEPPAHADAPQVAAPLPPPPLPPSTPPSPAAALPPRVRLAGSLPQQPRPSRARLWWRRATLGLAAAGLAMAAGAVVLGPHLIQRRLPEPMMAEAPPADSLPVVAPPPAAPPPAVAAAEPRALALPPEPAPMAEPVPPPPIAPPPAMPPAAAPLAGPPPAPAARPAPRPRVAATLPPPPPAASAPLPETQVAPSPWSVGRFPPPAQESAQPARVVTREPANIRRAPGLAAPVVRVTSAGMVLRVFGQRGPWVQVGDSAPWGWVHAAVVDRAS